ncbi:hypothetical protein AAF712_014051 [Marasmius tenuissimus]|uniref:Nephrocystin 3-like N-terminal domain-containing protein n=1 Tax=Marasmius tenuissimus TaxID=585030 RepID=A0ABR2ZEK6_9AGAR
MSPSEPQVNAAGPGRDPLENFVPLPERVSEIFSSKFNKQTNMLVQIGEGQSLFQSIRGIGASHTSERQLNRGGCLEGTCQETLDSIERWASGEGEDGKRPICILFGTAGVGKTSLAVTVAKRLSEKDKLTSYFFTRTHSNHPENLIRTIAYDLTVKIPSCRAAIKKRISKDGTILEDQLEKQLQELVLEPLRHRPWWKLLFSPRSLARSRRKPYLVIVDGLDEAGDKESQLRIIAAILSVFQSLSHRHPPLRFSLCSRPEIWIHNEFNKDPLRELTKTIFFRGSDADIRTYLVVNLKKISTSADYPHVQFPPKWPSVNDVDSLVRKASGQFAHAKDVVDFVKSAANPVEQLRFILDSALKHRTARSPYPELDHRYDVLLEREDDRVLLILAAVISPKLESLSPECIELLLAWGQGDVDFFLRGMHSVIRIRSWTDPIEIEHESFSVYLSALEGWPDQRLLLVRKWLQALSVSRISKYRSAVSSNS